MTIPHRSRRLLFIGDSITDAGRREDPEGIGYGYVRLIAEHFAAHDPAAEVINRGVGGDRTIDVRERFGPDALDLEPDVVTIYAGVNDTWRRYDADSITTAAEFEENYRFLLDQLSATRPAAPVILILPFVTDIDTQIARFHEDLDPKVEVIRSLAREFGHEIVDTEEMVRQAYAAGHTPESLAADGVHPTIAGHRLLADAWLEVHEGQHR